MCIYCNFMMKILIKCIYLYFVKKLNIGNKKNIFLIKYINRCSVIKILNFVENKIVLL